MDLHAEYLKLIQGNGEVSDCIYLEKKENTSPTLIAVGKFGNCTERLVMCWNTHDSLVSALKDIIPILEAERTHTGISLDIRYQTEYWAAKQLLNSLNIKP